MVTHSPVTNMSGGLNLTVSNDVVIDAGSAINVNGLGFGPGLGAGAGFSSNEFQFGFYYTSAGGGGFGGRGGSSFGGVPGGDVYGSRRAVGAIAPVSAVPAATAGHIALVFQTNQFTGTTAVSGGGGFVAGQSGTLWLSTNTSSPIVTNVAPVPVAVDVQTGNLMLQWSGGGGVPCQVQTSTDLIHWQPWGGALLSSNGPNTLNLPVGADSGTFFRLVVAQ
jgi:hypothetical protein